MLQLCFLLGRNTFCSLLEHSGLELKGKCEHWMGFPSFIPKNAD